MLDRLLPLVAWLPLFPLAAALLICASALGPRPLSERAVVRVAVGALGLSFAGALALFVPMCVHPRALYYVAGRWLYSGGYTVRVEFLLDPLSAAMLALVTGFGLLIARFGVNYMHREPGFARFYGVVSLFVAAMTVLVSAGNLMLTFLGWEVAGFCSYLLIAFYYDRAAPARAATRKFVMNRVGDVGFLVAIFLAFDRFGAVDYRTLLARSAGAPAAVTTPIALALLVAAVAKSAQLPLATWLARAMEGPTPSSALFYTAVMVNAGVYLLARTAPVFAAAPVAMQVCAIVGASTALYGAMVALVQTDVKSALIFSTTAQLGMMFLACGLGAPGVAVFHMLAHSALRTYQMLVSPSALRAARTPTLERGTESAQDAAPGILWLVIAALVAMLTFPYVSALTGGPPRTRWTHVVFDSAAGVALFCAGHYASVLVRRALTAVAAAPPEAPDDHGERGDDPDAPRPRLPATLPAWLAPVTAGLVGVALGVMPGGLDGQWFSRYINPSVNAVSRSGTEPLLTFFVVLGVGVLLLAGWVTALYFHAQQPERPGILYFRLRRLYLLALHRFWLDDIYDRWVVQALFRLGRRLERFDHGVLDRAAGHPLAARALASEDPAWEAQLAADPSVPAAEGDPVLAARKAAAARVDHGVGRATGVVGQLARWASSTANLIETHVVGSVIGQGIPSTGSVLGRALNRVDDLLGNPLVVVAIIALGLIVVFGGGR